MSNIISQLHIEFLLHYESRAFRYRSDPKLLLLSDLVESEEAEAMIEAGGGEFQGSENFSSPYTHLILQDLFASDFQMAEIDRDENGLDFTHTILALAKLATFHAVSYCMKKEKGIDFHERYILLKTLHIKIMRS